MTTTRAPRDRSAAERGPERAERERVEALTDNCHVLLEVTGRDSEAPAVGHGLRDPVIDEHHRIARTGLSPSLRTPAEVANGTRDASRQAAGYGGPVEFRGRRLRRPVWLGSLGRTTPISGNWGFDRGTPVDRYYIERFLAAERLLDIRGPCPRSR